MAKFQAGDRVQVIGNTHGWEWDHAQHRAAAPVLVVQHQMPYEPDMYAVSDGTIRRESELHLVERPADVEVEHIELDGGRTHTRLVVPTGEADK